MRVTGFRQDGRTGFGTQRSVSGGETFRNARLRGADNQHLTPA